MKIKIDPRPEYPYDEIPGFTKLDEIEWSNRSYEFDITGLWTRDSDGTLWMAHDSGCSCPCEWERVDEMERVFSVDDLRALRRDRDYGDLLLDDWERFLKSATDALEKLKSHGRRRMSRDAVRATESGAR